MGAILKDDRKPTDLATALHALMMDGPTVPMAATNKLIETLSASDPQTAQVLKMAVMAYDFIQRGLFVPRS